MSVDFEIKDNYDINDFLRLVTVLRSPGGCRGTENKLMNQ